MKSHHSFDTSKSRGLRNALEAGESHLSEAERGIIAEYAKEPGVNEEVKMQEILISIGMEGGIDPVLTIRPVNTCITQLREEVEQHWKAKEAEAELKEVRACQLDYLKAGSKSLEDAFKGTSTLGVGRGLKGTGHRSGQVQGGLNGHRRREEDDFQPRWNLSQQGRRHLLRLTG
jgi:hypothetical protein